MLDPEPPKNLNYPHDSGQFLRAIWIRQYKFGRINKNPFSSSQKAGSDFNMFMMILVEDRQKVVKFPKKLASAG
jgi:hypothetical protein